MIAESRVDRHEFDARAGAQIMDDLGRVAVPAGIVVEIIVEEQIVQRVFAIVATEIGPAVERDFAHGALDMGFAFGEVDLRLRVAALCLRIPGRLFVSGRLGGEPRGAFFGAFVQPVLIHGDLDDRPVQNWRRMRPDR